MRTKPDRRVILGTVGAPFGVQGWVRVHSQTSPAERIAKYPNWQLSRDGTWQVYQPLQVKHAGGALAVQLANAAGPALADRDAAAALTDCEIAVWRSELPKLKRGEFYWTDLIGLEVVHEDGRPLGAVERMMETGANDVLVVREGKRERLIPFVQGPVVLSVDLAENRIVVDWAPEF